MNDCDPMLTSALIDGELEGEAATKAQAHVDQCLDCQTLAEAAVSARALLRSTAADIRAPDDLRARIRSRLDAEEPLAAPRNAFRFWQGAASGVGASLVAATMAGVMLAPPPADRLVGSLADAHVQALMSGHQISVVSSNHHTVRPWFAGRAPIAPPAPDLAAQGFTLAGGRTQWVGGRQMAVVVYRHGLHEIDLFVWRRPSGTLPAGGEGRGYRLLFWSAGDLAFAAVSDMDPAELSRFAGLVRATQE